MSALPKPPCYQSNDAAETFVRNRLVHHPNSLQNHNLNSVTEQGDPIARMRETIPGQYNTVNGIDIFGIDVLGRLWIIEVSRGNPRGAARFKGAGKPVKYAGGNLQMSRPWRIEATEKFLNEQAHATTLLRILFSDTISTPALLAARLRGLLPQHQKAIIIPDGAHFDTTGTDIDFIHEVYTCPFPPYLLY